VPAARRTRGWLRPPGGRHGAGQAADGRPASEQPAAGRRWAIIGLVDPKAGQDSPAPARQERFGLLLIVLVGSYIFSAFASGDWVGAIQILLFVWVATLAVRSGKVGKRATRQALIVTAGGSLIAITLALTHSADAGAGVASVWAGLMLLFAVVVILRRVLVQPTVTLQSIFGAVSAYLIIGLMFASFYGAIYRFGTGDFFVNGEVANVKTFQYFSFTTLTTLGYGDFTAASSGGRAVAVLEALFGQVFLATLVARLVAAYRAPSRAQPGAGPGPAAGPAGTSPADAGPGGGSSPGGDTPAGGQAPRPARPRGRSSAAKRISSLGHARPARRSRSRPGR
jgi:hypothetical protein